MLDQLSLSVSLSLSRARALSFSFSFSLSLSLSHTQAHREMLDQLKQAAEQSVRQQQEHKAAMEEMESARTYEEEQLLALSTEVSRLEAEKAARASRQKENESAIESLRKEADELAEGCSGVCVCVCVCVCV